MLVLSRKKKEIIRIGENIVIRIEKIGRKHVSISIDAPNDITILRGELLPQNNLLISKEEVEKINDDLEKKYGKKFEEIADALRDISE